MQVHLGHILVKFEYQSHGHMRKNLYMVTGHY